MVSKQTEQVYRLPSRIAELMFRWCFAIDTKFRLDRQPHPFARRRHNRRAWEYRLIIRTETPSSRFDFSADTKCHLDKRPGHQGHRRRNLRPQVYPIGFMAL